MKNLLSHFSLLALTLLLAHCARPEKPARFKTRELTPEEIREKGYDKASPLSLTEQIAEEVFSTAEILNSLATVAQTVIARDNASLEAKVIAQALPAGATSLSLTGTKTDQKVYEKKLESVLGSDLVVVDYKVSYQYAGAHKGKGSYISNVKFTPLKVKVAPLWSLGATASSEGPTNVGTEAKPVAQVGFSISFSADGVGSGERIATDEFILNGASGELKAEIRDLDD